MLRREAAELEQLVARCAAGDAAALQRLYQDTASQLFGVLKRILVRADLAEEALQDVYVSIWRNAKDYRASKGAVFTWMTSIVRNRCLDWLRRPHPESGGEEYDIAAEAWHDEAPEPLERMLAAADVAALARCMRELESRQRQSIALAFFHGLSHSELAAHMRQPLGTVKTWVRRGLLHLRECLGNG